MNKTKRNVILVGVLLALLWGVCEWLEGHGISDPLIPVESYEILREKSLAGGMGVPDQELVLRQNQSYQVVIDGKWDWNPGEGYYLFSNEKMADGNQLLCHIFCRYEDMAGYLTLESEGLETYKEVEIDWDKGYLPNFEKSKGQIGKHCYYRVAKFRLGEHHYTVVTWSEGIVMADEQFVFDYSTRVVHSIIDCVVDKGQEPDGKQLG